MQPQMSPFNLDLLILTRENLRGLIPVQVLDIFEGSTRNFHPLGLFSSEIFGKIGDERRSRHFSYIDLRISVFHPVIFKAICDLKQLYGEILAGASYAVWDAEAKDFVKSNPLDGQTGFAFFVEHFLDIQFDERESDKREFNIKLIRKYGERALMDKLIVIPAGLRDYEYDEHGKPSEGEVNTYYRQAFSYANLISDSTIKLNPDSVDATRYAIQLKVSTIYDYFKSLLEGKKKMVLGKWASRRIYNGTRNVITSLNSESDHLDSPASVGYNSTVVGLYQYVKAVLPITMHKLRTGFLSKVFIGSNSPAVLVNRKTLKKEMVHVDPSFYDEWMTNEGLEKVLSRFGEEDLRHLPVMVSGYYVGLIYCGPDMTYKVMQDISELPESYNKDYVHPMTFAELLYLSVYKDANSMPCFVTRYPILAYGGIYPSYVYLKSTVRAEQRAELGDNWSPTGDIAYQFPIIGEQFTNSMSPHPAHNARLGADYDGDTCSLNVVYSDEAKAEVKKCLNSRKYYVGVNGRMNFSAATDTVDYVLASMTRN